MLLLLAILGLFQAMSCYKINLEKPPGLARGRVEVKTFVEKDLPFYHNLVLKYIPGATPELLLLNYNFEELNIHNLALPYVPGVDPELIFMDYAYQELARVDLMPMTRKDINELLLKLGFYKKESPDAKVPDDLYYAPMIGRPVRKSNSQAEKHKQAEELIESDEFREEI